jgi:hypothetical protein
MASSRGVAAVATSARNSPNRFNAELSAILERVRLIKGISNTETSILLASFR